jgi:hypothetical protein
MAILAMDIANRMPIIAQITIKSGEKIHHGDTEVTEKRRNEKQRIT